MWPGAGGTTKGEHVARLRSGGWTGRRRKDVAYGPESGSVDAVV